MRFRKVQCCSGFLLTVVCAAVALAQNATGAITGVVTDQNGALMPNATVTVTNIATGATRRLATGSEGNYSAESLAPGEYEVKVEAKGFTSQIKTLIVQVGATANGAFTMSVGTASQTIEVIGGAPILNTADSGLGGVISQKQVESLPLNGRSFLSVAMLEPGVTVTYQATSGVLNQNDFFQVGIGGAPSYMTVISVDGARVNDRITGGSSQNFSSETVQEFQIGAIGFDLSTGTVSAGAVNIVSRSGGNQYHGSGFFFFRDHNLAAFPDLKRPTEALANGQARNPLCLNPTSDACKRTQDPFFVRRQYGGTIGGPIRQNKLFFFANYERNDQLGAQPVNFNDQRLVGFAHVGQVPFDQHLIGTRLDYRVNDKHSIFARGNIDKNNSVAGAGLESTWIASSNYAYQTQFGLTSVLTPKLVNDFRFSYSYFRNRLFTPDQETCERLAGDPTFCFGLGGSRINFFGGLTIGNNTNTPQDRHPRTYQFTDNVSLTLGAHRLRFGANWEHTYSHGSWFRNFAGTFSTYAPTGTSSVQSLNPTLYSSLPASLKPGHVGPRPTFAELLQLPVTGQFTIGIGDGFQPVQYLHDKLNTNDHFRFYIQDGWQIRPSFMLNYGLGWSFETNEVYHELDRPEYLRPTGIQLGKIPPDLNNFDPALGFAWSLNDKTVIRSSFSIHHSSGNRTYLKLQDQILIGPAGSGLTSFSSGGVANPKFGQPGQPATLDFGNNRPVNFRAQDLLNYLPTLRNVLESSGRFNGQDLSIRNIEARKAAPAAGSEALFDANYRTPYTIHLNAGVQRQILPDLSVSADFVMRRGVKFGANEFMLEDINRWNRFSRYVILGVETPPIPGVTSGTAIPTRNPVIPACVGAQANDPKAQCSVNSIFYGQPGILSRYSALQVKVDKRFSRGFSLTGAYALSRYTTFNSFTSYADSVENYGLSGATPKHAVTFSGIWDLPQYGGGQGWLRGLLSGWQLSTIMQMQSRDISSVTLGTLDVDGDGLFVFRLPGAGINSFGRGHGANDIRRMVDEYNARFPAPPDTPLRDIGRANRDFIGSPYPYIILPENFSSGDSFLTHDLRVTRTISLKENVKLSLIAEGFNIFNIANLSGFTGSLASAAYQRPTVNAAGVITPGRPNPDNIFGQATSRVSPIFGTGGPRAFQLAARLRF